MNPNFITYKFINYKYKLNFKTILTLSYNVLQISCLFYPKFCNYVIQVNTPLDYSTMCYGKEHSLQNELHNNEFPLKFKLLIQFFFMFIKYFYTKNNLH